MKDMKEQKAAPRLARWFHDNRALVTVMVIVFCLAMPTAMAFADDSNPTLTISLNLTDIFTYAQLIVNALIPIVLITAGFGLGFFVLKVIANAFKSLG